MVRKAIGAAAGLACVLLMALSAEAQSIGNTPTGPTKVYSNDTSSLYTSTVVTTGSFYVRLRVWYLGVIKHNTTTYVSSSGTVNFSKLVTGMDIWGMTAGQQLNYNTRAYLAAYPTIADVDDWFVPILTPPTTFRSPGDRDRYRETVWA